MFRSLMLIGASLSALSVAAADEESSDFITLDAVYTGEVMNNVSGGIKRGTAYMDNFDLMLTADFSKVGVEGGTLFLYGLYNNNQTFSDRYVGDAQVISNIDSDRHFRLYEAWYEQKFADGRASIKAGIIDLNSEFDAKETSSLFINSAHGIGSEISQTGLNGPSIFPSTSLAIRADAELGGGFKLRAGIFDAVPNDPNRPARMKFKWNEGTLYIVEAEFAQDDGIRAAIGTWGYSSKFEPILPHADPEIGGNRGIYGFVEGPLSEKVRAYLRAGTADSDINQFKALVAGGVVWAGPVSGRDEDQLGIGFAHAVNGKAFKDSVRAAGDMPDGSETNLELTYRAQISDWLAIQPDVQYVINPGAVKGLKNPLVLGLRFELATSF